LRPAGEQGHEPENAGTDDNDHHSREKRHSDDLAIAPPSTSQNARRTAYQVFDSRLAVLRDFLSREGRGWNARDLEVGVSWLLWLLGFSVANLGGTARTQDFADLVATTPYGHFVVVAVSGRQEARCRIYADGLPFFGRSAHPGFFGALKRGRQIGATANSKRMRTGGCHAGA
jgi:hypothetical protein